jgi:hypothetical protein
VSVVNPQILDLCLLDDARPCPADEDDVGLSDLTGRVFPKDDIDWGI